MTESSDPLELRSDLTFLRREWMVERLGWGAMLVLIVVAALGLFGGGPLSRSDARSEDGVLRVDYNRFLRVTAHTQVGIEVGSGGVEDGQVQLWVSHEYLHGADIESVLPEPSSETTSAEGITFTIDVEGTAAAVIVVEVEPTSIGPHGGDLGLVGGSSVHLSHFVYP